MAQQSLHSTDAQPDDARPRHKLDLQPPQYPSQEYLHPEDAFITSSPRRRNSRASALSPGEVVKGANSFTSAPVSSRPRGQRRGRSSSRKRRNRVANIDGSARGKATWKKLLWVKQNYPDNYTDEETFLDHYKINPRLRPYEFWTLVSDSTIIVQHLCSVVIFVCCFTAIFQERVSPQTVVSIATLCTVAGWVFRDFWRGRGDVKPSGNEAMHINVDAGESSGTNTAETGPTSVTSGADQEPTPSNPFQTQPVLSLDPGKATDLRTNPRDSSTGPPGVNTYGNSNYVAQVHDPRHLPPSTFRPAYDNTRTSILSPRMLERLTTVKSAILIYCSLLGLSPILKSLTQSTSSDSIWALSSWLMGINVFTFDYGAGPEAKFPASLSTNAALMASTVLASRLPSTTHVFSLTLFSIEVFGLFPVFRRHLRHHSWLGHLWLTTASVICASGGLSMTISGGGWTMGILGAILGSIITCFGMGATSWWLIGLQRYKNEIHGPWDPARPVIRRH